MPSTTASTALKADQCLDSLTQSHSHISCVQWAAEQLVRLDPFPECVSALPEGMPAS